jgi:hypothetical protein
LAKNGVRRRKKYSDGRGFSIWLIGFLCSLSAAAVVLLEPRRDCFAAIYSTGGAQFNLKKLLPNLLAHSFDFRVRF